MNYQVKIEELTLHYKEEIKTLSAEHETQMSSDKVYSLFVFIAQICFLIVEFVVTIFPLFDIRTKSSYQTFIQNFCFISGGERSQDFDPGSRDEVVRRRTIRLPGCDKIRSVGPTEISFSPYT